MGRGQSLRRGTCVPHDTPCGHLHVCWPCQPCFFRKVPATPLACLLRRCLSSCEKLGCWENPCPVGPVPTASTPAWPGVNPLTAGPGVGVPRGPGSSCLPPMTVFLYLLYLTLSVVVWCTSIETQYHLQGFEGCQLTAGSWGLPVWMSGLIVSSPRCAVSPVQFLSQKGLAAVSCWVNSNFYVFVSKTTQKHQF